MDDLGFITVHRKILKWEWYDHVPTKVLFIHCLLRANHTKTRWRGQEVNRGQFITSLNSLSQETGLSIKQVRVSLDNLEKTKELGKETTRQNTVITVLNYDLYQSKGTQKDKQGANEGQRKGKRGATDNNDNNDNNEYNDNNKEETIPAWEEFLSYAINQKKNVCRETLRLKYESWKVAGWKKQSKGKEVKIINWKSTLLNTLPYIEDSNLTEKGFQKIIT